MKKILFILSLVILVVLNYSCKKDVDCIDCIEKDATIIEFCTNEFILSYEVDSVLTSSYADNIPSSFLVDGKEVRIKFKPTSEWFASFSCAIIAIPLAKIELVEIQEL